jgi:glycosyltransferase involved in cell wall biosynthesis
MKPHIVLFFTRGVSLRTWSMFGMLDREVALYRRLCERGFRVSFLTYGGKSDLDYAGELGEIRILCNEQDLPPEHYVDELVSLHGQALADCDVIKTNQTYGSDIALAAAQRFGIPLIARCGYMWSMNAAKEHGADSPAARKARRVEANVFASADRVVVTTEAMRANVTERMPEAASKIRVIPNYVDTDVFRPFGNERDAETLLFVGRIAPEKNLESLLEAIGSLQVKLVLIGEGKLRPELQRLFHGPDGKVTWEGNVPNSELPAYLNGVRAFVLPSLYEGHPKALLEAMSCGTPVIGADSPGIRELIHHRRTGLLCGVDSNGIRGAITELLGSSALCQELGWNARRYVLDNFSLEHIVEIESAMLEEAIVKHEHRPTDE